MAKLPSLVTALAEVDGRDRKSVEHIGRTIREAGYIPTSKRGSGAAEMSVREAANFIIALNGADTPKDGPVAIDRFRSLRQWFQGTSDDIKAQLDSFDTAPEAVQNASDCRVFGEALEALIEGVPSLAASFQHFGIENLPGNNPSYWETRLLGALRLGMFGLDVTFQRYAATVELFAMFGSERRVQCAIHFMQDEDRAGSGFYGSAWPDRKVTSTIGMPTLVAAWQGLNPGVDLPGIPAGPVAPEADYEE
jgi:hypothetical protein